MKPDTRQLCAFTLCRIKTHTHTHWHRHTHIFCSAAPQSEPELIFKTRMRLHCFISQPPSPHKSTSVCRKKMVAWRCRFIHEPLQCDYTHTQALKKKGGSLVGGGDSDRSYRPCNSAAEVETRRPFCDLIPPVVLQKWELSLSRLLLLQYRFRSQRSHRDLGNKYKQINPPGL